MFLNAEHGLVLTALSPNYSLFHYTEAEVFRSCLGYFVLYFPSHIPTQINRILGHCPPPTVDAHEPAMHRRAFLCSLIRALSPGVSPVWLRATAAGPMLPAMARCRPSVAGYRTGALTLGADW